MQRKIKNNYCLLCISTVTHYCIIFYTKPSVFSIYHACKSTLFLTIFESCAARRTTEKEPQFKTVALFSCLYDSIPFFFFLFANTAAVITTIDMHKRILYVTVLLLSPVASEPCAVSFFPPVAASEALIFSATI